MVKKTIRAARRKKKSQLTQLQLKVVKAKVAADLAGKSQASAAQTIWPHQTPAAASVSMSRVLKSANVNETWKELMAERGLSPDAAIDAVIAGLSATKPLEMRYWIEEEQATVDAIADEEGIAPSRVMTKMTQVPDHSTRINAAKVTAQWMGVGKKPDPDELPPGSLTINFNGGAAPASQFVKK